MLTESKEQRKLGRIEGKLSHFENLQMVLGDGRDWEYTGIMQDLKQRVGKCSCGHKGLRYLFTIQNIKDGRTAIVGSTCIEHFSMVNPELVERIKEAKADYEYEAKERLRQAKRNIETAEAQKMINEGNEICWKLEEILSRKFKSYLASWEQEKVPYEMYIDGFDVKTSNSRMQLKRDGKYDGKNHPFMKIKQYKRHDAMMRAIKERIVLAKDHLSYYLPN